MNKYLDDKFGKYSNKELEYVIKVLNKEKPLGQSESWTQEFEAAFAKKLSVKYAIACNSGTSGLHAALIAAGVKPGDEVISPGLTVIMDSYAVIHVGATPVFADVDKDTQNIDPIDFKNKITEKTKAVIVVSLQGLPVDMDPVLEIAREHGVKVIEDSAQTLLGKYKNKYAGTIGDLGVFSFENKKHITCGSEGGMIVTNDEEIAIKARKFAGIGYKHLTAKTGRTSLALSTVQDPSYERFDTLGLNYRMNEVSAAVGLGQLERVEQIVQRRQIVAGYFRDAIAGCHWMVEQLVPDHSTHSHYTFSVQYFQEHNNNVTWKEIYNKYLDLGGDGFYAACKIPYLEPVFKNFIVNGIRFQEGLCPVAETIQPRIMQFKTNYRDLEIAKRKASILAETISSYRR